MACNEKCPCHKNVMLTVAEILEVERNHFDENGVRIDPPTASAAQGDVHWLDWHEHERG
jgi:hypothetical protein